MPIRPAKPLIRLRGCRTLVGKADQRYLLELFVSDSAAGASLGGGNVPSIATDQKFCFCTDPMGIPQLGMTIDLWNPARLIEVVRNPWCSPALGGHTFSASKVRLIATTGKGDFDASEMSFFNYHYFAFPLTILLDLFWDNRCNADGYQDFDLLYVSELDPTGTAICWRFSPVRKRRCLPSGGHCRLCRRCDFCCHRSSSGCLVLVCRAGVTYILVRISPTSYGTDPRITSLLATRATAALHRGAWHGKHRETTPCVAE